MSDIDHNKEEEENENKNKGNEDEFGDDFGLPDISYDPIERKEEDSNDDDVDFSSNFDADDDTQETSSSYGDDSDDRDDYEDDYEHPEEVHQQTENTEYTPKYRSDKENKSNAPLIITLILLLVLVGGALAFFLWWKPMQEAKEQYNTLITEADQLFKDKKYKASIAKYEEAKNAKQDETRPDTQIRAARAELKKIADAEAEAQRLLEEQQAAEQAQEEEEEAPEPGTVETISSSTGRYYVIVASNIDGDLATDYAKELSLGGVSSKVIPPFGGKRFYRVAVADYDTFADAEGGAADLRGTYGEGVWVLKY
ncbi:MAG: SPOR domain-containing protein [Bacteroidota bacterium]